MKIFRIEAIKKCIAKSKIDELIVQGNKNQEFLGEPSECLFQKSKKWYLIHSSMSQ